MASKIPIGRSMVLESIPSAITEGWKWVLSQLEANSFSQEDIFAVHLGLEEAFINAITHGNKMNSRKEVKIDYSVGPDRVEIFMMDEGKGFDPDAVPDPRHGENVYKIDGRGLFLMRSYMDIVEFDERGNCVHMVKFKSQV